MSKLSEIFPMHSRLKLVFIYHFYAVLAILILLR